MTKLKEDFRIAILGGGAGLFSICVPLMVARIDAYYAFLSWLNETHYGESYYKPVEDLWWVPIGIWHVMLTITAALLAHRHLSTRVSSPFLLWQIIGIASLVEWGFTVALAISIGCLMNGNLYPVEHLLNSGAGATIAKFVSAAFASNVLFASMMNASSRQYTAQLDELSGEELDVDHLLTTS